MGISDYFKNKKGVRQKLRSSKTPDLTRMSNQSKKISADIVNAMDQQEFAFEKTQTTETKPNENIYIIQKWDTLWEVSKKVGIPLSEIIAFNGITNPDLIEVNQKIKLPSTIHSSEVEKRVQELSAQILAANNFGKITTDAITTTPCFMKEERLEDLVNAISNQKGDFTSIIYFNGPRNRLDSTFTEHDYQTQLAKLKNLAKKDPRIIVIDHLYSDEEHLELKNPTTGNVEKKIPMGTIRADMMDAIKATVDYIKVKDPKIIGIDADTYKLDEGYIMGMTRALNVTHNKFLKGALRDYSIKESKGDERSFILERVWLLSYKKHLSDKNVNQTLTGATFGFKLSDYNTVWGFPRDPSLSRWEWAKKTGNISGAEDDHLNEAFYQAGISWQAFTRKIYVDPRRWQDAVNQGFWFQNQYGKEFTPIQNFDVDTHATPEYKQLTEISRKLLNGEIVSDREQQQFETELNNREWIQEETSAKYIIKRWNINTVSKYKMSYVSNGDKFDFKLEKKL